MRQREDRHPPARVQYHRLKAVLALRSRHFEDFCRALPVTMRHAHFVLTGARTGSAALLDAVRQELGEPDWAFASGQCDTLLDNVPAAEVKP